MLINKAEKENVQDVLNEIQGDDYQDPIPALSDVLNDDYGIHYDEDYKQFVDDTYTVLDPDKVEDLADDVEYNLTVQEQEQWL